MNNFRLKGKLEHKLHKRQGLPKLDSFLLIKDEFLNSLR